MAKEITLLKGNLCIILEFVYYSSLQQQPLFVLTVAQK